jgi:hypothetical protein
MVLREGNRKGRPYTRTSPNTRRGDLYGRLYGRPLYGRPLYGRPRVTPLSIFISFTRKIIK